MADENHAEWLKEGVKRWNRRRRKVRFKPDLSGIRFFDYLPPDFRRDPKTSRYFERIDLSDANISSADLSNLNFSNAKFTGANLHNSDISMSNFAHSDFTLADLSRANASLSHFPYCMFDRTIVAGTQFNGAVLEGAIFIAVTMPQDQVKTTPINAAAFFEKQEDYIKYGKPLEIGAPGDQILERASNQRLLERDGTRKNRYDVFYATNRDPIFLRGELSDFGTQNFGVLSFGVCEVIVPEGHRIGSLGSPLWKRLINRRDDRLVIENNIWLSEDLFWMLIKDTGSRMKVSENPTVFIHGFNTSFEQAVLRSAQIGYDLGIGQGIGLFSWPSKGKIWGYSADETSVEASKYLLADFIEAFTKIVPRQKINLIAHSMGCRCLIGALEVLSNGRSSILGRLNQVIMAAADIDSGVMPNQGRVVVIRCKRMTSYVSDLDKALQISGWLHSFPRVGITPPTFILKGMDTIVVNDLNLGHLSHTYVSSSRTILHDVFELLKKNTDPSERHAIEAVSDGASRYWKIRN